MFDVGFLPLLTITILIPVAWLLTKRLKPEPLTTGFKSPKTEAITAIAVTVAIFSAIALFFALFLDNIQQAIGASNGIGPSALLFEWTFYAAFFFIPILAILKVKRQKFESIGVTKKNLKSSLVIGALLSVLWLAIGFTSSPSSLTQVFSISNSYGFFYYMAIGFGEEFLFRGYLQHRCVAWQGATKGLFISSLVMAFAHIPQRIFVLGINPLQAMVSSAFLFPISIFLGIIFLRTQNIIASSIFHTVLDFANSL